MVVMGASGHCTESFDSPFWRVLFNIIANDLHRPDCNQPQANFEYWRFGDCPHGTHVFEFANGGLVNDPDCLCLQEDVISFGTVSAT